MNRPPLPEELFRLERQRELAADVEPFGHDIAERVANGLQAGWPLGYAHRDYCGTGLHWQDGRFYYAEIYDSLPYEPMLQVFDEREAFVAWLAGQSTASLARLDAPRVFLHGNQTITRWRVLEFIEWAESRPPPQYPQRPTT